jgi:hypothetical protein
MGLYDQFECYGHFYQIVKDGIVIASCRSQLDIIDSKRMTKKDMSILKIDAMAIMMNPGTSKPLAERFKEPQVDLESFPIHGVKQLVATKPDDTQKRLMRIMKHRKWKYIRVINLSDIRQHESEKLASEFRNYKMQSPNYEHSLFSSSRKLELLENLKQAEDKPIILAWGTKTCLKPFAIECLNKLEGKIFYGTRAAKAEYYHHPLTTKIKWVDSIIALLDAKMDS